MTNSETHRQFYLATAGIRMWYAKRPLPGAAPSPEYQFDDDERQERPVLHNDVEVVPALDVMAKPSQPKREGRPVRSRAVDLQALMAPQVDSSDAVTEETVPASIPAHEAPTPEQDRRPAISVHLSLWATENFVLISQWSEEASGRLQDTLARNLLGALGESAIGERFVLQWPVFRNPNIPGNSTDDFQQVLSRLLSTYQNRSIILLGVLSGEQESQRERCLKPAFPLVGVDFPYSLAEISAISAHKRDLWHALKSHYSL